MWAFKKKGFLFAHIRVESKEMGAVPIVFQDGRVKFNLCQGVILYIK